MKKVLFFCIAGIFFMSNVVIAQPTSQKTYGLCIGIAEYDPADLTLKWADTDAEEFCGFLKDGLGLSKKQYKILTNRKATKKNILKQLDWLQKVAKSGDRVYIFYSGHGKQNSPLLPYNSDNLISLDTLKNALNKIDAKEIILFADANYSGKISGGEAQAAVEREGLSGLSKDTAVEIARTAKADMVVITSADGIQLAYELIGQEHGIFAEHLVRALMDKERYSLIDRDGNGELTLYEVYERVFGLVANESDQDVQITDPRKAKEIVVLRTREPAEAVAAAPTPTPTPTPEPKPEPKYRGVRKGMKSFGGSAGYYTAGGEIEGTGPGLSISGGYFVVNKLELGIDIWYSSTSSNGVEETSSLGLRPTVTYHFPLTERTHLYVGAGIGWESYDHDWLGDGSTWDLAAKIGVAYFVGPSVALTFGGGYEQAQWEDESWGDKYDVSKVGLNVGVKKYF